jgi:hypothetical protein
MIEYDLEDMYLDDVADLTEAEIDDLLDLLVDD